jgi:hypothetical protein
MIIAWQIIEDGELVAAGTQDTAKISPKRADPAEAAWRVADAIEKALIAHAGAPMTWRRRAAPAVEKIVL